MSAGREVWFAHFSERNNASKRLFCFPYAGGGPNIYRSWVRYVPKNIEIVGIRLPGREQRYYEKPYSEWPILTVSLLDAFQTKLDKPYAFFGHSLGARLAYEMADKLGAKGDRPPHLLIVSACCAPFTPRQTPHLHNLPFDELRQRLLQLNDSPAKAVLTNDQIMLFTETLLRADLKLAETWEPSGRKVSTHIAAFFGVQDAIDPKRNMRSWNNFTSSSFSIHGFAGGHFFINEQKVAVVKTIVDLFQQTFH